MLLKSDEYSSQLSERGVVMRLRPIKAIRKKFLECCGGSYKEIRGCMITDCPLYPYRFGKRPKRNDVKARLVQSEV